LGGNGCPVVGGLVATGAAAAAIATAGFAMVDGVGTDVVVAAVGTATTWGATAGGCCDCS